MADQRWTALIYLCGDTPAMAASIQGDAAEIRAARLSASLNVAMFVDLPLAHEPRGAVRSLLRHGIKPEDEWLGQIDSGSTATFREFLLWGIRELPADHYVLAIGGTGMLDPNSVVGHPENNWTDVFAICDDASAGSGMDIADLRGVIESVLDESKVDRLRIVAFDMCTMQFLEVAYEFEAVAEIAVAAETAVPTSGWNYDRLLTAWSALVAADAPAGIREDITAADIARLMVDEASVAYGDGSDQAIVVSAVDVTRLNDLTRDFDALTVAYMQALGDSLAWQARHAVATGTLGIRNFYDLRALLCAIRDKLQECIDQPLHQWLGRLLTRADAARRADFALALERACAKLRPKAAGERASRPSAPGLIEECVVKLRDVRKACKDRQGSKLEEITLPSGAIAGNGDIWAACLEDATLPVRLREEYAALKQERERAEYLVKLAERTLRHFADSKSGPSVILHRSPTRLPEDENLCGIALYRPQQLDRLIDSNYLKLEFSRRVHWTALLGATNLIGSDPWALWRVVSSMLGSSDPRGREELIERLVGQTSVGVSYRGQFRALTPSPLVTLSLEPLPGASMPGNGSPPLCDRYRLRLESLRRDATLKENDTRVNPRTIECALSGLEDLLKQGWVDSEDLEHIESFGRTLGEDIIQDLEASLENEAAASPDRDLHMLLRIPQQLMKYPWELMHDGKGWLSERYALGRQVFTEQSAVRWSSSRRTGGVRALIIGDPLLQDQKDFDQLPGARDEAEHVAALFERLQEQVGVALDFDPRRDTRIHQVFTRDECRRLLRSGAYDIIHFAGHAFFDAAEPLRSGWVLSDGPLWAQEIRNTLMRANPPWLVYANACEAGMDDKGPRHKYQGDVHGLASAFINKGVGAYIAPLWPIDDGMAMKLAADFYTLLALDRMTVGEALCHGKRRAKAAVLGSGESHDSLVTVPTEMGLSWASLVLYGDPTQTLVQQLAARSDRRLTIPIAPKPLERPLRHRARRSVLHGEAPLQAAPSMLLNAVRGPGMRAVDRRRGPANLRVDEHEMAVVEKGGLRYWATIDNGEPRPLEALEAATDGDEPPLGMATIAERSELRLRRERGFSDYVKIVARWATGRVEQGLVKELVQQYDRDVVPAEQLLVHNPATYELRPYTNEGDSSSSSNPQARGCLLLIHGTFSLSQSPVNGLGRGFLDWAHRNYRHVLAFDHWTLSRSPLENAALLCKLLPRYLVDPEHPLDIITHSRGGLVARALVQLPLNDGTDAGRVSQTVKRVVFVGTPNFGTSLADPANWSRAADLLINLVHVDALGLYGKLSGFLARLVVAKAIEKSGDELLKQIPGLLAQSSVPGKSELLTSLRSVKVPSGVRFSAVSTNYEPRHDQAHLKFIAKAAGDAAADAFFDGFNDLVVNSKNVWTDAAPGGVDLVERKNLLLITPPDSGFDVASGPLAQLYGVHHTNLFETEDTRRFLVEQLRQPVN